MQTKLWVNFRQFRQGNLRPVLPDVFDSKGRKLVDNRGFHRFGHRDQACGRRVAVGIIFQNFQNFRNISAQCFCRNIRKQHRLNRFLRFLQR